MSLSRTYVPRYFLKSENRMSLRVDSTEAESDVLGFHKGIPVIKMESTDDSTIVKKVVGAEASKVCGKHVTLSARNLPRKVIIINSKNIEIPLTQCTTLKPIKVWQKVLGRTLEFSKETSANNNFKDCTYQVGQDKANALSRDKKKTTECQKDKKGIACSDFQEFEAKFYQEIVDKDPLLSPHVNNNKEVSQSALKIYESRFTSVEKPLKVYGRRKTPVTLNPPQQGNGGSPLVKASEPAPISDENVMGKIKHFKDKSNQESHSAVAEIKTQASEGSGASTSSMSMKAKNKRSSSQMQISKKRMFIRREIERCLMQQRRSKKSAKIRSISTQTSQETSINSTATQTDENEFSIIEPFNLLSDDDLFIRDNGADANFGQGPVIPMPIKYVDCKSYDVSGKFLTMSNMSPYKLDENFGIGDHSQSENEKMRFFQCLNNCTEVKTMGNLNIHLAVSQNDVLEVQRQCIALRLRQKSLDTFNDNDMTPLHLAVLNDCMPSIVQLLLKFGADITLTDQDGNNPLHLAVLSGAEVILGVLLSVARQKNFQIDLFNFEGFSPLMLATLENNKTIMQMLLDAKANPNLRDQKSGRTPLFHAVESNNIELVRLLLKYKANTRISNFFGTSTHEAIFELDNISPEIKSMVIGKDIMQNRARANEKKRRAPQSKEQPENNITKKPKFKIVKMLKKVT